MTVDVKRKESAFVWGAYEAAGKAQGMGLASGIPVNGRAAAHNERGYIRSAYSIGAIYGLISGEAAVIAAEKRDKFLRSSGMILGIQGGMSYTDKNDTQILGEPKPVVVSDSGEKKESNSDMGGIVGPIVALRLGKHFAIQSGANIYIDLKGPSELTYTYVQVPALVRGDWHMNGSPGEILVGIGVFGGLAFNIPINASSDAVFDPLADDGSQTATMTIPMGAMIGLEVGYYGMGGTVLVASLRYTFDFGETTVKLADGHTGAFDRSSFDIGAGIKFYIPFKK